METQLHLGSVSSSRGHRYRFAFVARLANCCGDLIGPS
jgi:hypothetical protein